MVFVNVFSEPFICLKSKDKDKSWNLGEWMRQYTSKETLETLPEQKQYITAIKAVLTNVQMIHLINL